MSAPVLKVLAAIPSEDWRRWQGPLQAAFAQAGLRVELAHDLPPAEVDYIIYAPSSGLDDFTPFTRARAVLSLWAGVERIVGNPTLTQPLTRMVDPGLREGMREYVTAHVLRLHLDTDRDVCRRDAAWQPYLPPLARDRHVGILGLGELGQACAQALAGLGFQVSGWSQRPKRLDGVDSLTGADGLQSVLSRADFLVTLLPQTPGTENIVNARTLAMLPKGAVVINPGRGPLIDDTALLAALDAGHLRHAVLDVFRTEPLPADHPYWVHPKVTVTPHVASATRPETASAVLAENVRRAEAGAPLLYLVDRQRGY
ncbi:MAG TPA: glyoxylate/hydroxypyruvate reductase A [Aliiroseovarius sp.]|nr:glyoxylate/hydroxypyruvate reductase A [Aliiroseovarius sp.]